MRYFFFISFTCCLLNAGAKYFEFDSVFREMHLSGLPRKTYEVTADEMIIEDDGLVEVYAGKNTFFYRHLTTAVCESRECYPAEITLYWDFAGNYLGFEVPKENPLNKTGT